MASVPLSVEDPAECHRVNAQGTLRLLDAARAAGVRRFVYASTSAIYGNPETLPTDEDSPAMPLSPYAQAKLMGENFCRCHADAYGMQTVCLRYFNVFGPRQDPAGQYAAVVPLFIQKALAGEPVTIFGDGEQTRDFVYVGDVVRANMLAAAADGVFGAICNVARGTRHSINELLDTVRRLTGNDVEATHAPQRPGDVRHSGADISRARRVLGYEPRIPLEEGLRRTIEAFCEDLNE
jgi:UDP-glucose 4-epimerase